LLGLIFSSFSPFKKKLIITDLGEPCKRARKLKLELELELKLKLKLKPELELGLRRERESRREHSWF